MALTAPIQVLLEPEMRKRLVAGETFVLHDGKAHTAPAIGQDARPPIGSPTQDFGERVAAMAR